MFQKQKGFTLIELLVVVAIMGLLAGVVLVAANKVRVKMRDTKRKVDLKEIRLALELYYNINKKYPQAGSCAYGANCYVYSMSGSSWIPAITAGGFMPTVPVDPINNGGGPWNIGLYSYSYGNVDINGQSYDLTTQLENTSDPDRCELKCYKFSFGNRDWCTACGGEYNNQIYEDSPLTQE